MDPHLVHIPRLTALSTGRLPGGDFQRLGRQAHGALDAQVLGLGPLEELGADFFQRLHFARGKGDADFVDFLVEVDVSTEDGRVGDRGIGEGNVLGLRRNLSRAFGMTW